MATDQFTTPPEPDVYGRRARRDAAGAAGARAARRRRRHALRARAVPGRVSHRHGRAELHRLHLGGQARGGVRGHHGHEPVLVRLRPRVRRPLRARLPARRLRRPARDPQPQALRHGPARRHAPAAAGGGDEDADRRHRRRRPGRADGGAGPGRGRLRGRRLRADGHARRLHDVGHPRLPLPAGGVPRGHRPDAGALPGHHRPPGHRPRLARHARRAEGAPRRGAADDRRVVGEGHADRERGRPRACIDGVEFLRRVNGGERMPMPSRVIVVGAGDVAMDACRAARRLPGCEDVQVLYRRGPEEIPARKDELHGAIEEGIEIVYNVQPTGVHETDDGRFVAALRAHRAGRAGRRRPAAADRHRGLRARLRLRPRDHGHRPAHRSASTSTSAG